MNVEHIIVDGGSKDGTLAVVATEGTHVTKIVSEKDDGIYDAMNKGIALATGDIVCFINADDYYASGTVLATVAAAFQESKADSVYGDLCYVRQADPTSIVRYWRSRNFVPGSFQAGWCPPHPTFFVRRVVYQQLGGFDLNFEFAADFELMARYLESAKITSHYIPAVLVLMRLGGTTNRSLNNILKQNGEIWRALKKHGLKFSPIRFLLNKFVSRSMQFVRRPA